MGGRTSIAAVRRKTYPVTMPLLRPEPTLLTGMSDTSEPFHWTTAALTLLVQAFTFSETNGDRSQRGGEKRASCLYDAVYVPTAWPQ
jgi:hypothetical protein